MAKANINEVGEFSEICLFRAKALDQLIDEMIEFGIEPKLAARVAPEVFQILNDPGGAAQANLAKHWPWFARKIGIPSIH